jgi:hypothetical protein
MSKPNGDWETSCGGGASAPPPAPAVAFPTRLDNIHNNSDKGQRAREQEQAFFEDVCLEILEQRVKARRNNAWQKSRVMVNSDTGEIVTDKEGNTLTLADMSKSWYSARGSRNNAFQIVKRLQKAHSFESDLKACRPKFITLTFAEIGESWKAERALQKFLDVLRHWAKRECGVKNLAYFWTAEVQERGALHYHILVLGAPFLTKERLSGWWSYGFVDIRAVDDMGRAFKYLAKYLWKWGKIWDTFNVLENDEVAALPAWWFLFSVFSKRRYGFSKWFQLRAVERIPRWIRDELCSFLDLLVGASRAIGGGWCLRFAVDDDVGGKFGYVVRSPYKVLEFCI